MRHPLIVVSLLAALALAGQEPARGQKIMAEGIKDLATQIATNVAKEQKRKIAVLPFRELDGQPTVLGTYISEELVTDLFTIGGIDIVERSMLDKLLGELKLGQTGLIDPDTAKQVGKVAGVDAIVTGSITDLQSYVALNCRLIDAQTGRIFSAAQTKIVKDDDLRKIMGVQLPTRAANEDRPAGSASGTEPQTPGKQSVEQEQQVESFLFVLKSCTLSGKTVLCDLLITNQGDDAFLGLYGAGRNGSRLISEEGNEYAARESTLGNAKGDRLQAKLVSRVSMKASVTFGVSPEVTKAALVEIRAIKGFHTFSVQFRDVALTRP